jgi:hypothetical protein
MTPTLDDLNPDFLDLLRALVDSGVEFVVVGPASASRKPGPPARLRPFKVGPSTSSGARCTCATSSPPAAPKISPTPLG